MIQKYAIQPGGTDHVIHVAFIYLYGVLTEIKFKIHYGGTFQRWNGGSTYPSVIVEVVGRAGWPEGF